MTTTTFDNLITFSRTSNATVVGSNGLIQWAPSNSLTSSQSFTVSGWFLDGAVVTPFTGLAPDGTTTATGIALGTGNNRVYQFDNSGVLGDKVFSLYVKAGVGSIITIGAVGGLSPSGTATVNASAGTVSGLAGASIVSVGGGWYRVSLPVNVNTASGNSTYWTISATGAAAFIWGAQLERGLTATTYNNTSVRNLLGFSEAFDNAAWTKFSASIVTGAQANPVNGLFNAQKLMENTANAQHRVTQSVTLAAAPHTLSAYLKAGGRTWALMVNGTIANGFTYFDLSTGAVGTVGAGVSSASITPVANGWYRCSITFTAPAGGNVLEFRAASANGTGSYTGDGNSGVYIYGAMLSNSASLDPYVPTPGAAPTSTAYYGPRFDYDPVTLAPRGLLVEEQRTNLLLRSEELDNVAWSKSRASVTANATTSPNGTSNADKVIEDTATGSHRVFQQATKAASSLTRTFSVYLKASERALARIQVSDNTELVNANALVDLSTGTIGTASITGGSTISAASATIINAGNGWYRCSITATFDATITNPGAFVALRDASGATSYTGDGTSGMFAWGAMWEDGPFTTSYIPTVASQVTRTVDNAVMTGSNLLPWYNPGEGTFVVEADSFVSTNLINVYNTVSVNDGTGNNQHRLFVYANRWAGSANSGGVTQADLQVTGSYTPNVVSKTAYTYRVNDIAVSISGSAVMTDTAATMPASFDRMGVGSMGTTGHLNGHVRRITYYPRRLSNTQIQELSV